MMRRLAQPEAIPPSVIPPMVAIGACGNIGLVEAPQDEIVRRAAGLRAADRIDVFHVAGERVGDPVVVGLGVA